MQTVLQARKNKTANFVSKHKHALRKLIKQHLVQISEESKTQSANTMCRYLSKTLMWKQASFICSYLPLAQEANPLPLLELALSQQKEVLVPLPDSQPIAVRRLRSVHRHNSYCSVNGLVCRVPVPSATVPTTKKRVPRPAGERKSNYDYSLDALLHSATIGIILVPGLAFSLDGSRLGRGGGFYDRMLAKCTTHKTITSVGLCYNMQILADNGILQEPHDKKLDYLLSEEGLQKQNANPLF